MNDIISVLGILTAISTYLMSMLSTEFEKINTLTNVIRLEKKSKIRNVGLKYFLIVVLMNLLLLLATSFKIYEFGVNNILDFDKINPFVLILDCYIFLLCILSINELIKIIKEYKS
jgi:hypothetical protein